MNDLANVSIVPAAGVTLGDKPDGGVVDPDGGGGGGSDPLSDRLIALTESLATETEIVAEWYAASQETLIEALEAKQITEEEYRELRERLEQEHEERMAGIRETAGKDEIAMRKQTMDAALGLIKQFGQKNKAAAKVAVALNAAQRVAEITANTAAAAIRTIAELGPIAGPPAAARIMAFGAIQKGIALASAAMSMSGGGGGSSGGGMAIQQAGRSGSAAGGGGATGGGGVGAAPAMARQNIVIDLVGDTFSGDSVKALIGQINDGLRRGYQIEGVLAR